MEELSTEERIQRIVDDLVCVEPIDIIDPLFKPMPRLDVSRPNIHDSKGEFLLELEAVRAAMTGLDAVVDALLAQKEDAPERKEMVSRLQTALDERATLDSRSSKPKSVVELIQKNIAESGFYVNSLLAILGLSRVLSQRESELLDQEREFWTISHRPPNYYARTIALRLARLYAQKTGKKPTFGTARDGSHPSTDFGRALEQIFEILEIKSGVKNAAEWAMEQLTEDDLKSPPTGIFGLLGSNPGFAPRGVPSFSEYLKNYKKGSTE